MKYYMRVNELNVITYLGSSKRVPSTCQQITRAQYNNYKAILSSIPNKDGYDKIVTLYVDGTYEVEYVPIVVDEDEEEQ